jgi:hypothetical protein
MAASRDGTYRASGYVMAGSEVERVCTRPHLGGSSTPLPRGMGRGCCVSQGDVTARGYSEDSVEALPLPTASGDGAGSGCARPLSQGDGAAGATAGTPSAVSGNDGSGRRLCSSSRSASISSQSALAILHTPSQAGIDCGFVREGTPTVLIPTLSGERGSVVPQGDGEVAYVMGSQRCESTLRPSSPDSPAGSQGESSRKAPRVRRRGRRGNKKKKALAATPRRLSSTTSPDRLVCCYGTAQCATTVDSPPVPPLPLGARVGSDEVSLDRKESGGSSTPRRDEPRGAMVVLRPMRGVFIDSQREAGVRPREAGGESFPHDDRASPKPLQDALCLPSTLEGLSPEEAEELLRTVDMWAEKHRYVQKSRDSPACPQPRVDSAHAAVEGPACEGGHPSCDVGPPEVKPGTLREGSQTACAPSSWAKLKACQADGQETAQGARVWQEASTAHTRTANEISSSAGGLRPLPDAKCEEKGPASGEWTGSDGEDQRPLRPQYYPEAVLGRKGLRKPHSSAAQEEAESPFTGALAVVTPSSGTPSVFPRAAEVAGDGGADCCEAPPEPLAAAAPVATPPGASPEETLTRSVGDEAVLRAFTGQPGGEQWSVYRQHLAAVSSANGWDDEQTSQMFLSALEGRALEYLNTVSTIEGGTLSMLLNSFERGFAEDKRQPERLTTPERRRQVQRETVSEERDNLPLMVRMVYPTLSQDELECRDEMRYLAALGLSPTCSRGRQKKFAPLDVRIAEALPAPQEGLSTCGVAGPSDPTVVAARTVVEREGSMAEPTMPPAPRGLLYDLVARVHHLEGRLETLDVVFRHNANCYNCGRTGHLRHECTDDLREDPAGDRYGRGIHWLKNKKRTEKRATWAEPRPPTRALWLGPQSPSQQAGNAFGAGAQAPRASSHPHLSRWMSSERSAATAPGRSNGPRPWRDI